MSEEKPPSFRGTKATLENYCAKCGTDRTAGCWRRGWAVDSISVNLCNRCGLQYKNGKLDRSLVSDVHREAENSPRSSYNSSTMEPIESSGPYATYSIEREADVGVARRVLFYVQDAEGNEKLALSGYDARGTGHFVYESEEGFYPSLKCKNRKLVFAWLEEMGAVRQVDRFTDDPPSQAGLKQSSKIPQRPTFDRSDHLRNLYCSCPHCMADREYCEYREESVKEGETESEQFYLVDADGNECLAICGSPHGDRFRYRCVLDNQDTNFESKEEVLGWLKWVVGKVESPPYRFLKKEPRKPIRTRDSYSSSLADHGAVKRRLSGIMLDDMQAVFEDRDLLRWVLRKPTTEEIEIFHHWSEKLKLTVDSTRHDDRNNAHQDPQEVLEVLRLIQEKETCLKLLEVSSLGRPISALRRHPNKEVSDVATEITKCWNEWTTRALDKAAAARKKLAWMK